MARPRNLITCIGLAFNVERKKPRAQTLPESRGLLRRRVFRSEGNVRVGFRVSELRGETQAHAARYNFGEMLIAAKYGILHAVFGVFFLCVMLFV